MFFSFDPNYSPLQRNGLKTFKRFNNVKFKHQFAKTISTAHTGNSVLLMQAFERDGLKCKCCEGSNIVYKFNSKNTLYPVLISNNKEVIMTKDHDVLKSLGGSDDISNINALCYDCNQLRGNDFATFKEFKEYYDSCNGNYIKPTPNYCSLDVITNIHRIPGVLIKGETIPHSLKEYIQRKVYSLRKRSVDDIKFNDIFVTIKVLQHLEAQHLMQAVVTEILKAKFHIYTEVQLHHVDTRKGSLRITSELFTVRMRQLVKKYIKIHETEKQAKKKAKALNEVVKDIILTSAKDVLNSSKITQE